MARIFGERISSVFWQPCELWICALRGRAWLRVPCRLLARHVYPVPQRRGFSHGLRGLRAMLLSDSRPCFHTATASGERNTPTKSNCVTTRKFTALTLPTASCTMNCCGRLAQLVRAPALQAGGRRFEPCTAHHLRAFPTAAEDIAPARFEVRMDSLLLPFL
jgi:hypothetical protein